MVMVMFGYKHVEILLQKVAEILVSFWYTTGLIYWVQLGLWSTKQL